MWRALGAVGVLALFVAVGVGLHDAGRLHCSRCWRPFAVFSADRFGRGVCLKCWRAARKGKL